MAVKGDGRGGAVADGWSDLALGLTLAAALIVASVLVVGDVRQRVQAVQNDLPTTALATVMAATDVLDRLTVAARLTELMVAAPEIDQTQTLVRLLVEANRLSAGLADSAKAYADSHRERARDLALNIDEVYKKLQAAQRQGVLASARFMLPYGSEISELVAAAEKLRFDLVANSYGVLSHQGERLADLAYVANGATVIVGFGVVSVGVLIWRLRRRQRRETELLGRYHTMFADNGAAQLLVDAESWRVLERNAAAAQLIEGEAFPSIHAAGGDEARRVRRALAAEGFAELRLGDDENRRDLAAYASKVTINGADRFYVILHDISEQQRMRRRLEHLADFDALTTVRNRRSFLDVAANMLAQTRRGGALSLALIDIDHFKQVNDTHGHAAGDAVLAHVARLLQDGMREADLIGRLGGEEFAVALHGATLGEAVEALNRLRETLARTPAVFGDRRITVTASFGVACVDGSPATSAERRTVQAILADADAALYRAKRNGRNRVETAAAPVMTADV